MSLVAVCKKCGRTIRGRDELAGRPFRCPDCHELNEFPVRSSAATVVEKQSAAEKPPKEKASGICPVCGFDLWVDPDQITDVKGRRMHRACFEEIRPREKPEPADTAVVELFQRSEPRPGEPAAAKRAEGKPPPSRPPHPKPPMKGSSDDDLPVAIPIAAPVEPQDLPEAIPEAIPIDLPEDAAELLPEALPAAAAKRRPKSSPH